MAITDDSSTDDTAETTAVDLTGTADERVADAVARTRAAFARLLGYIESGKVTANLYATYPLSEFHRAQGDFIAKGYVGKLVVMPDRFYQPVQPSLGAG